MWRDKMLKEQILEEAERRGCKYLQEFSNCSQCTLLVIQELLNIPVGDSLKAATGFSGGIGRIGLVCGALTGGIMTLGLLYGRDLQTMKHPDEHIRINLKEEIDVKLGGLIKKLCEKFKDEYGSFICNDIETKLFGRPFDKWNPADREEKERLGGHKDKCPMVVGKAARWVLELIIEEQTIS